MDSTELSESNDENGESNKEDKGNKIDREQRLQTLDGEIKNLEGQILRLRKHFAANEEHKKSPQHALNKERIDKYPVLKLIRIYVQSTNDLKSISMYWQFHATKRKFTKERAKLLEEQRVNTISQYFKDEGVPYYTVDDEKAEEGKAWAQLWLSKFLRKQGEVERSRHWLETASNQGSAEAQYYLAMEMRTENNDEINDETLNLFRAAATGGNSFAQSVLAHTLMERENYDESIRWFTFCAAQGRPVIQARFELAQLYELGKCGLEVSEEMAIYWYKRAIEQEEDSKQCFWPPIAEVREVEYRVAVSLTKLSAKEQADDMVMPEVMFWLRRSASKDFIPAVQTEKKNLEVDSKKCRICHKVPGEGEKLRRCTRCNFPWYCGTVCQKQHWKMGHRHVCYDPAAMALKN